MKQIIVEVSPEGEVKIDAVGYKGQSCSLATKALELALGVSGKDTRKPEYSAQEALTQKVG